MNSFYTRKELEKLNIKKLGDNVLISRKASIYGNEDIEIGSNVRVDDFCILSGNVKIGDYVHISAYTSLFGGKTGGIIMDSYTTISSRCVVYALSDDYSGKGMTNVMIPPEYRMVYEKKVHIKQYAIIGSGCTVLPGVIINEGAAVGAMSLINKDLEEWGIYVGIPCRKLRDRDKKLLDAAAEFEKQLGGDLQCQKFM